nr:hypothetical protein [Candidatus Woesearchaeota archaeon]
MKANIKPAIIGLIIVLLLSFMIFFIKYQETNEYNKLVKDLEEKGAKVEIVGDYQHVSFSAPIKKHIRIEYESVFVFEYENVESAELDASKISGDASRMAGSIMVWFKPPHLYKKNELIVLYLGDNEKVINFLEEVLGEQFAGA